MHCDPYPNAKTYVKNITVVANKLTFFEILGITIKDKYNDVASATVIAIWEYGMYLVRPRSQKQKQIKNTVQLRNLSCPRNLLLHPNKSPSLQSRYSLPRNETRPSNKTFIFPKTLPIIDRTIKLSLELNLPYKPNKLHKYRPSWALPNLID